jgi:FkbM family methyltransferase
LSDYVIAVPLAFGNQLKLGQFYLSSNIPGSATHGLDEAKSEGKSFEPTHKQGVLAMSLDDFVRLENVAFPNHIKIDVDGLEKTIVENMANVLADPRLKSVIIEIAETVSHGSIEHTIKSHGFREEYRETVGATEEERVFNILFVRR